jgi:hypothetical protein
MDPLSLTAS